MAGSIAPAVINHRPRGVVRTRVHLLADASGVATAAIVGVGFGKLVGVAVDPGTLDFSNAIITVSDSDTGKAILAYDTLTPAAVFAAGNPSTAGANAGDVFTSVAHGLQINDEIVPLSFGGSSTGLTAGTHYWVKSVDTADTFQLSAAAPDPVTGVPDDLLALDGDVTDVVWVKVTRERIFSDTTTGDATGGVTENLFTAGSDHGLAIGDRVQLISKTGGTGLSLATDYYVIPEGFAATTFELSTTVGGTSVDFTTDVSACVWQKMTYGANLASFFRPTTNITTNVGAAGAVSAHATAPNVNRDIFLAGKIKVALAQGGNLGEGDIHLFVDEANIDGS